MDLTPYIEGLRRDLVATAAHGGPDVSRAAELLTGSLEASTRLCLLEALSEAMAEITTKLRGSTVDIRLRGREADLTVTELTVTEPIDVPVALADSGELSRITLRLPEHLKEQAEHAAAAEGASVNAWLVRAITAAVNGRHSGTPGAPVTHTGRRLTGFAQA